MYFFTKPAGYDIGYRYAELLVRDKPIGTEELDVIKFICKDVWFELFRKNIDKLQMNRKGMFVLSDTNFRWVSRYASNDPATCEAAERLLHFPCGLLRGLLANLGYRTLVTVDFTELPACTFNIKIKA